MTNEDAAKILDPEKPEDRMDAYGRYGGFNGGKSCGRAYKQACTLAGRALRRRPVGLDRRQWEGCPDCRREWGVLDGRTNRFEMREQIFCGSCGRPLTDQAWAELERRIGGNDGKTD